MFTELRAMAGDPKNERCEQESSERLRDCQGLVSYTKHHFISGLIVSESCVRVIQISFLLFPKPEGTLAYVFEAVAPAYFSFNRLLLRFIFRRRDRIY
jgi:hypothetical protein